MRTVVAMALLYMSALVFFLVGWIGNIVWLINHHETTWHLVLGVVGIFMAPVGVIHGWGLLFGWWH